MCAFCKAHFFSFPGRRRWDLVRFVIQKLVWKNSVRFVFEKQIKMIHVSFTGEWVKHDSLNIFFFGWKKQKIKKRIIKNQKCINGKYISKKGVKRIFTTCLGFFRLCGPILLQWPAFLVSRFNPEANSPKMIFHPLGRAPISARGRIVTFDRPYSKNQIDKIRERKDWS